jgi:hypothetical protein
LLSEDLTFLAFGVIQYHGRGVGTYSQQ